MYKLSLAILVVLVTGCTIKYTSIDVPQEVNIVPSSSAETTAAYTLPEGGTTIRQTITVSDSAVRTSTDQDADADVPIALGMPGSTPASSVGGVVQEGVKSSNTVPVVITPPVVIPKEESVADPAVPSNPNTVPVTEPDLDGYTSETHTLKHMHDDPSRKLFNWLDKTGSSYGTNIQVEFSDGEKWVIDNGAVAQGADGNTENHNQMFWFSGNPELQKDTNMGCSGGCASIFPSPDSKASTVTISYKKE